MLNNQDFAQKRQESLGGSDIGAILGLSPYRTATDVWLEKTGKTLNSSDALPLRFGQFAESFVANEYCRTTGHALIDPPGMYTHAEYPFLTGHIDRLIVTDNETTSAYKVLECKTAHPFKQSEWGQLGSDEVPMSYLVQCLWYLMITNLDQADIAVLFGNTDFRIYNIHRDMAIEQELLERATYFWSEYVQKDQPPPHRTLKDNQKLFSQSMSQKSMEANTQLYQEIQQLSQHQQLLEEQALAIDTIKSHIMETLQDAEVLTYQNQVLATWKAPKASQRIDSKRLQSEHPELYQNYLVPIQNSRRLTIKELS
jgi:putative phage-type endonuclease